MLAWCLLIFPATSQDVGFGTYGTRLVRYHLLSTAFLLVLMTASHAGESGTLLEIQPGEVVSDIEFTGLLDSADYGNLGIDRISGPFRLAEIHGEVLILEFFNKGCAPCQRQVREVEAFYGEIALRRMAHRVRVLAVAAGNQAKYLGKYRKKRGLTYPITADPHFDAWRMIGEPGRTPFTVFLRRRGSEWLLAHAEYGVQDMAELLSEAMAVLESDPAVAYHRPHRAPVGRPAPPPLNHAAEMEAAASLLARVLGSKVEVENLRLSDGRRIYRAEGRDAYALFAQRAPLCEVCHGVSFALAFDREGRILGFEAVEVYKWGNEAWTEGDGLHQESRLVGKKMRSLVFDERVDAVSRATISSSLIFDEVRRLADILADLPD